MSETIVKLAVAAIPYLLGLALGFVVAILGLKHWFNSSALQASSDLLSGLKRIGLQSLVLGLMLTWACSSWLAAYLTGRPSLEFTQHSLWGLPFGLLGGARWMFRRGER